MATTDLSPITVVPKTFDIKTRINLLTIDGVEAVEFRDWVQSLNEPSRGFWFPATPEVLDAVIAALQSVRDRLDA